MGTALLIVPSGFLAEHACHVASDEVDLEVDLVAGLQPAERGVLERVRNQVDAELGGGDLVDIERMVGMAGLAVDHLVTVRLTPFTVMEPL